jgi:hypothetical protein
LSKCVMAVDAWWRIAAGSTDRFQKSKTSL